ncbi:MAG: hypothetical protein MI922_17525 [Bacteroidales bacterium]|nr:hypothetical protein [Bacteroidales bacterium]
MKFNLKGNALICASMVFVAVSCDKEMENTLNNSSNPVESEKITVNHDIVATPLPDNDAAPTNGYTDEELAAQGWEVLSVYDADRPAPKVDESNLKAKSLKQKKPNMQGLKNMGYSYNVLWGAARKFSNPSIDADGYNINGEEHGKSVGKGNNLAQKYGWWLYADLYKPLVHKERAKVSGWKDVKGTRTQVSNRSNKDQTCPRGKVSYTKSLGETVSWNVESTAGLSWNFGINIQVFQLSVTPTIQFKAGHQSSKSSTETVSHQSDAFKMKAKSKYEIVLQHKTARQTIKHSYPVQLTGRVGFNYKKKVQMTYKKNSNWAYWWGIPAEYIFTKNHYAKVTTTESYVDSYRWSVKYIGPLNS